MAERSPRSEVGILQVSFVCWSSVWHVPDPKFSWSTLCGRLIPDGRFMSRVEHEPSNVCRNCQRCRDAA